ncbi:hypothetical protein AB0K09_15780 [Streptomyces sp. NPDC049577]|uniref:hypothetical protein n=1 Tax=Streptomyces sp. NPDC049577 TaxID=3155153 RepID=UPI00341491C9
MTVTTVQLSYCVNTEELYRHYDQQAEPQPVFVELDLEDGVLYASYDPEVGNARPAEVGNGRTRRYCLTGKDYSGERVIPTAEGANRLLERIAPLAQRVLDGASIEWNGHNRVGVLDEDAQDAEETIKALVEDADLGEDGAIELWDMDSIGEAWTAEEAGITARTSDEELERIEARLLEEFRADQEQPTAVIRGLGEHLRAVRDELNGPVDVFWSVVRGAQPVAAVRPEQAGVSVPEHVRVWAAGHGVTGKESDPVLVVAPQEDAEDLPGEVAWEVGVLDRDEAERVAVLLAAH